MSDEKKLTDEEIVKALECDNDEQAIENALDLIHRLQSENAKQKAEIERLTGELEKQVDELTAENARLNRQVERNEKRITREMNIGYANERQAVKNTAKEIYGLAVQYYNGYETDMERFILTIKDRYGVEVE